MDAGMIIDRDSFVVCEAHLSVRYSHIESIVAYLKNFEKEDLPETIKDEILPMFEEFLIDNL